MFGERARQPSERTARLKAPWVLGLLGGAFLLTGNAAHAGCLSRVSGPIVYDVLACKKIQPNKLFDTNKPKYDWIDDLDPKGKKQLYQKYSGLLLKGKVVKSSATEEGLTPKRGALKGKDIFTYLPPSPNACKNVKSIRVAADIQQICCDGGGNVPCLLGTPYLLKDAKKVGKVFSEAGHKAREKAANSKVYAKAQKAFRRKQWKKAAVLYERAWNSGALDLKGQYRLGLAYRRLESCDNAVPHLKRIHDKRRNKDIWADQEKMADRAVFLLARCYAVMNKPAQATMILNGYLIEPRDNRWELKHALTHEDFGWIHTSEQYQEFKKSAKKALRKR